MATETICLFDIDGTLLSTGGAGQLAMERALLAEFGVTGPYHDIPAAGRTDKAITTDLFAFHGMHIGEAELDRFLIAYFSQLPVAMQELNGRLLPGIRGLLDELHPRPQIALGLLTGNFEMGARLKLEHYGIHEFFQFGGYGDHHHDRDDVARVAWEAAAARLQCEPHPEQVWVIGDTPSDVKCARAIGARAVAVCTGIYSRTELADARPDHLFDDFSDFSRFLNLLG